MRAGRLDRKIKIMQKAVTRNEFGEDITTLEVFMDTWAEKKDITGTESYISNQFKADVTTLFNVRYCTGITPLMWIEYDGRKYDILAALEIGRKEGIAINAKARAE